MNDTKMNKVIFCQPFLALQSVFNTSVCVIVRGQLKEMCGGYFIAVSQGGAI